MMAFLLSESQNGADTRGSKRRVCACLSHLFSPRILSQGSGLDFYLV